MKKVKKHVHAVALGACVVMSFRNRTFVDRKKKADKFACRKKDYQA